MNIYTIILPTFNDWKSLSILLSQIEKHLKNTGDIFKVLIIDDNSTKKNNFELNKNKFFREINILSLKKNVGSQKAIATGLKFISKNNKWTLTIIGSGSINIEEYNLERVIHKDFMDTKSLAEQSLEASCLILPSRSEQWGVVVHEFSSAGLALILSDMLPWNLVFLIVGITMSIGIISRNILATIFSGLASYWAIIFIF